MKKRISLGIPARILHGTFVLSAVLLFSSGCSDVVSVLEDGFPAARAEGEGDVGTAFPQDSRRYDLRDARVDAVICDVKFVNESEAPLYYWWAWPTVTLQKWNGTEWEDRGYWYYLLAVAARRAALAPGDAFNAPKLDLRAALESENLVDGSGYYRYYFEIYEDDTFQTLIPEASRVSGSFEVIL